MDDRFDSASTVVPREALRGRLDSFLLDRMDQGQQEFVVRVVRPRLTWNRLDLAIKLYYLEQSQTGPSSFAGELYDAHIHAFSLGDFREPGNDAKQDAAGFRSAFRDIVQSFRIKGFDPLKSLVPVASDGSFINGGHRTACAMFLNSDVHVVETGLPPVRYDYQFFRSRGLDEDLLEASIVKYMERSPHVRLALVWPGTDPSGKAGALLGPFVYRKPLALSPVGHSNLGRLLGSDGSSAQRGETTGRRSEGRPVAIVFDLEDEDALSKLEARIHAQEPTGSRVHLMRTREESLDLGRLLLNEKSLQFLNAASPERFPSTSRLAADARDLLQRSGISTEKAVLGARMLLATYGAREAAVPDLMLPVPENKAVTLAGLVERHLDPEIIEDPRRHLHYNGLKFLSVAQAMETVRQSGDPGASDDLRLLESVRAQTEVHRPGRRILYRLRLHHSRLRRSAILMIARLGLRDQAKAVYRALRRPS